MVRVNSKNGLAKENASSELKFMAIKNLKVLKAQF